jgi:hypothetical protein
MKFLRMKCQLGSHIRYACMVKASRNVNESIVMAIAFLLMLRCVSVHVCVVSDQRQTFFSI